TPLSTLFPYTTLFRSIYICSVVSDHYPALAVQGQQFLKYETTDVIQPPLVTDVFFVDVLAEMLTSPLRLLSYINRRVNYIDRVRSEEHTSELQSRFDL